MLYSKQKLKKMHGGGGGPGSKTWWVNPVALLAILVPILIALTIAVFKH